jgi:DNA-directed RNA polymerase specialized sigma24 family protein
VKSAAVPLPRHWKKHVKSAVIAALGLARFALMQVRGWCADSPLKRVQLAGERDAALARAARFEEEARILRARVARIDPQRRPQYPPPERMAILTLRAATGWSAAETARRFQITEATVAS